MQAALLLCLLYFADCRHQPAATKAPSKPGAAPSSLSSTDSRGVPDTSPDPSDDADAAGLEQDEVAAARAQLKARAGAKGRRGGKAAHVGSGQSQVCADLPDLGKHGICQHCLLCSIKTFPTDCRTLAKWWTLLIVPVAVRRCVCCRFIVVIAELLIGAVTASIASRWR